MQAPVEDVARVGERPNILLLCVDQMRRDWMGCAGHPLVQTPQLDVLAAQGIYFPSAMSECPVCVPARRILMTGRDSYGINMRQNRDTQPFPEGPKLAELVSAQGYQTYAVGKMHTWPPRNRMGFDDILVNEEGRTAGLDSPDDYTQFLADRGLGPVAYAHGLGNNQYGYRPSPLPEEATTTGWTADQAMRFLQRRDPTRPFFLYASFDKPHPPFTPPNEYFDLYRDVDFPDPLLGDWIEKKPLGRIEEGRINHQYDNWRHNRNMIQQSLRAYAALITHIDTRIGQLLGTLREQGLLANTWVFFVADHGEHLFEHHMFAKSDFLSSSGNIPYMIVPPGRMHREFDAQLGQRCTHPVGLIDILPTLVEIAGGRAPEGLPGQSLLPFFREKNPAFREISFGRCQHYYAATDGRYKLHWSGSDDVTLLFDEQNDPHDLHDLADDPDHAAALERLRTALVAWMETNGDPNVSDSQLVFAEEPGNPITRPSGVWNNRGWRP